MFGRGVDVGKCRASEYAQIAADLRILKMWDKAVIQSYYAMPSYSRLPKGRSSLPKILSGESPKELKSPRLA